MSFFFKNNFKSIFFKKEGSVIVGNRFLNFYVIFIILFTTFFALGIADGSKKYLAKRMDNPFNNWVNFGTHDIKENELFNLITDINSLKSNFHIKNIDSITFRDKFFFTNSSKEISYKDVQRMTGISINKFSSIFYDFIIKDQSFIKSCKNYNFLVENFDDSHGIIVKRKMLNRLGLSEDTKYLKYYCQKSNSEPFYSSIPVLAIVDDLPLKASYLCSFKTKDYFINQGFTRIKNNSGYNSFELYVDKKVTLNNLSMITENDKENILLLDKSEFFESELNDGKYFKIININDETELINKLFLNDSQNIDLVCNYNSITNWHNSIRQNEDFDYVSIFLSDLDSIIPLKKYLDSYPQVHNFKKSKKKRLINIDIDKVQSLSNLNFISELTKVLSFFLLFFSMFSIVLFLTNIINTHFEKIKQNIGTLKAFGLSNNNLIKNYISIYGLIILSASLLSFLFAFIFGQMGLGRLVFKILNITIEDGEKCFELLNFNGIAAFLFIIILSISVVYFRLRKILLSTPGDLIFER